jgi:OOP family OmpA-OmpF porin
VVLGVSVSLGWIVGMVVAQVLPSGNPEPPLVEVALRQVGQANRRVRQLPRWWEPTVSEPVVVNDTPAEETPAPGALEADPLEVPPDLSEGDRQQLEESVADLQQDFGALEARLAELEESVGQPMTGVLEARLQQLEQLALATPSPTTDAEPGAEAEAAPPADPEDLATPDLAPTPTLFPEPRFSLVSDRIVLPSALLFEPGSSTLTPPGEQLLETIVADLERYPAATLLVGSHTAGSEDPAASRDLTFRQALAVQQYLEPQLEGDRRRWVVLGYGQSRPRVISTSPDAQQRNQRIDIGIVPQ